jgi:hypothetical protein
MYLSKRQLESYEDGGFLLLPECFSVAEVALMKAQLPGLLSKESSGRVLEKDSKKVRSIYGVHITNGVFGQLSRHPRIVHPAKEILASPVYVYQFKVNVKAAFDGDMWAWHQDYIFWLKEDGMPEPRAVSSVIFLDEVNEFNGPLYLIPKSHKVGAIEVSPNQSALQGHTGYASGPSWLPNVTASLKYSLEQSTVGTLAARFGMIAPKGPAGSVLFFHCNLFHGSPNNMSPFDRAVAIVTFNSTENVPVLKDRPARPDFLCAREFSPVVPLSDDAFLQA